MGQQFISRYKEKGLLFTVIYCYLRIFVTVVTPFPLLGYLDEYPWSVRNTQIRLTHNTTSSL